MNENLTVIFTIQHPAHVHLFRNSINILTESGCRVHTLVRRKDINVELLDHYDIEYELIAGQPKKSWHLPFIQLRYEWGIIRAARQLNADVLISLGEPAITHAAKLSSSKSLILTDTEHATISNKLAFMVADQIYTPDSFKKDIGSKQVRYPGYHELAYLHPNRFEPDPSRLREVGINPNETYSVIRFIGFQASHDIGQSGLSFSAKREIASMLDEIGDVYISSEKSLPNDFKEYEFDIPSHLIHDLLYYADYYIGDSGTMATEAAILGTPSIRIDPFAKESTNPGVHRELEERYNLLFSTDSETIGIKKLAEYIEDESIHDEYQQRRERLLNDKIDVTEFIVEQIKSIIHTSE